MTEARVQADLAAAPGIESWLVRLESLEARLDGMEGDQNRHFTDLMKFAVLRHLSVLSLMVELSAAPPRVQSELESSIKQGIEDIARADDLSQVRAIDVELQAYLRQAVLAFKRS